MTTRALVEDLREIFLQADKKPKPYDTEATVKRVEKTETGTRAWVSIPGGVDETPVEMSINASKGDKVQVRVSGGRAWLTGNSTAPPTDDTEAKNVQKIVHRVAETMSRKIDETQKNIDAAQDSIDSIEDRLEAGEFTVGEVIIQYCRATANAIPSGGTFDDIRETAWAETLPEYVAGKYFWTRTATVMEDGIVSYSDPVLYGAGQVAAEAEEAINSTNNHFWHDSSGAYVTKEEGTYATGPATRIVSEGVLLTYDGKAMAAFTKSGVTFRDSTGNIDLASYTSGGITFSDSVPFTIGNNDSFLKWIHDSNDDKWKIRISADEIEMGGSSLFTEDSVKVVQGTGGATLIVGDSSAFISDGEKGDTGATGATGATGPQGPQGPQGPSGKDVTSEYVTYIDSTYGVRVYSASGQPNNYAQVNSSGLNVVKGGTTVASFGDTATVGKTNSGHVVTNSSGIDVNVSGGTVMTLTTNNVGKLSDGIIKCGSKGQNDLNVKAAQLLLSSELNVPSGPISNFWGYEYIGTSSSSNIRWAASGTYEGCLIHTGSSSKRYKRDIQSIEEPSIDPHRLYSIPVVQFRYRDGYISDPEYKYPLIPGFIAEDVNEIYPIAVDTDGDQPEDWDVKRIVPGMLALIQEQNQRIAKLEERRN